MIAVLGSHVSMFICAGDEYGASLLDYRIAGLFRGRKRFCEFYRFVAVRENIIHEYCIAYEVWLNCENGNPQLFYSRNMLIPSIREKFSREINPPYGTYVMSLCVLSSSGAASSVLGDECPVGGQRPPGPHHPGLPPAGPGERPAGESQENGH